MTRLPSQAPSSTLPSASTTSRLHAEERQGRGAGLQRDGAGQRRDHVAAGLGLPPGVDDRAAAVADHAEIPFPRLGIDRLADGAEQAQAACGSCASPAPRRRPSGCGSRSGPCRRSRPCACRPPPRTARCSGRSARPRTSVSWRRWRAARRRCSCAPSPSRRRRCTRRPRLRGSRRRTGGSSTRRRDSRPWCAARPSARRSSLR